MNGWNQGRGGPPGGSVRSLPWCLNARSRRTTSGLPGFPQARHSRAQSFKAPPVSGWLSEIGAATRIRRDVGRWVQAIPETVVARELAWANVDQPLIFC